MVKRIHIETREEWLDKRSIGIGASESAAILGLSKWETPIGLWRKKIGGKTKDVSSNEAVQRGNRMEPAIREFFKALHPEYTVEHYPFDILYQRDRPYLFATLDGELVSEEGKHGILEIKTAEPKGSAGWKEWLHGNLPKNYLVQCIHQLAATGWDFVILVGLLYQRNGDKSLVEREIWRKDFEEEINNLTEEVGKFWSYVESETMPPQILKL